MATVDEVPREGKVVGNEPVSALEPAKTVPSSSLQGQGEKAGARSIYPGSPTERMPSTGVPKKSLTTGPVGARPPVIEVSSNLMPPPSSSEKLDYSGDDTDWDNVPSAPDTSKFSRMIEGEMQVVATTEGNTSSNIAKMIEELNQPQGLGISKIGTKEVSVAIIAGESSQP